MSKPTEYIPVCIGICNLTLEKLTLSVRDRCPMGPPIEGTPLSNSIRQCFKFGAGGRGCGPALNWAPMIPKDARHLDSCTSNRCHFSSLILPE